jgi:hypothetical protein
LTEGDKGILGPITEEPLWHKFVRILFQHWHRTMRLNEKLPARDTAPKQHTVEMQAGYVKTSILPPLALLTVKVVSFAAIFGTTAI